MSVAVGLPEALERAASELPKDADLIRPANGDPVRLLEELDPEAAARVLGWLLAREPAAGEELALAWADEAERGAAPLQRIDAGGLPKAGRKVLRRALHRLRSRGVAVEEPAPEEHVAKLPPVDDRFETALVSAIDPSGTRVAYLVESNPTGGARMFQVMLDETRGVLELEVFSAGRGKVRKFLREFARRQDFPAVEAPVEAVRALVERIAAGQPADRPLPRGFAEWRARIAGPGTTPGELAREALGDEGDRAALERVAERVRERRIGPWPPAPDALRVIAEKLAELAQGRIIVSGATRRDQALGMLDEAADECFAGPPAERTAQRFAESAYVSWKRGDEAAARDCLAAARAFREQPPAENPIARAILEVALAPVLGQVKEEQQDEEERSLLVKP